MCALSLLVEFFYFCSNKWCCLQILLLCTSICCMPNVLYKRCIFHFLFLCTLSPSSPFPTYHPPFHRWIHWNFSFMFLSLSYLWKRLRPELWMELSGNNSINRQQAPDWQQLFVEFMWEHRFEKRPNGYNSEWWFVCMCACVCPGMAGILLLNLSQH